MEELSVKLAYTPDEIRKMVHRLASAKLLYLSKKGVSVRNRALLKYCPIKRIIAIEAKLDKWNEDIIQAEHRTACRVFTYNSCNRILYHPLHQITLYFKVTHIDFPVQ